MTPSHLHRAQWAAPALAGLAALGVALAVAVTPSGGVDAAPSAPIFGVFAPPGTASPGSLMPSSRAVSTTPVRSTPTIWAGPARSAVIAEGLTSLALTSLLQDVEMAPSTLSVRLNAALGAPSAIATWEGSVVAAALAADPTVSALHVEVESSSPSGGSDTPLVGDVDLRAARSLMAGSQAIDEAALSRDAAAAGFELLSAHAVGALGAVFLTVSASSNDGGRMTTPLRSLAGRPYLVAVVDSAGQGLAILGFNPVLGSGRGTGMAWTAPGIPPRDSFGAVTPQART